MKKLVIICDPGKALDDEEMLLLLSRLKQQGLAEAVAVIANLLPSALRARLVRGTLKLIGMTDVPVGAGSAVVESRIQKDADLECVPYLSGSDEIQDGQALLLSVLQNAAPKSITLLIVAGMTDAATILASHQEVFTKAVAEVIIMGGVITEGDNVVLDQDGFMQPDTAVNNHYDPASAALLYRRLQELTIPLVILARHATYATQVPRTIYDSMAQTGHKVGLRLSETYRRFVADFWKAVNLPPDCPNRDGLPARWNRTLFLETFCEGKDDGRSGDDAILELVKHCTMSDPMTLIAAIPALRERFFSPKVVPVKNVDHLVIGVSGTANGLKDEAALVEFLVGELLLALKSD